MSASDNLNQDQFKVYFASKNDLYNEGDVAPAGFPNYDASGTFGTEGKPWFTNPMEAIRPIKVARRVAQLTKKPVADADEVTLYEGTPQGKVYTYSKGKAGENHRTNDGVLVTKKTKHMVGDNFELGK
jgi:hypothetical protein